MNIIDFPLIFMKKIYFKSLLLAYAFLNWLTSSFMSLTLENFTQIINNCSFVRDTRSTTHKRSSTEWQKLQVLLPLIDKFQRSVLRCYELQQDTPSSEDAVFEVKNQLWIFFVWLMNCWEIQSFSITFRLNHLRKQKCIV